MAMKARMKGGPRHTITSLNVMVKATERGLWPTPKAAADKYGGPRENDRGDLQAAVRMWPTPLAGDATGSRGSKGKDRPNEGGLAKVVKLWPTPKSSPSGPDYARASRDGSGGDDLATAVARKTSGQLNPTWVEWLMGFDLGWTDLGA